MTSSPASQSLVGKPRRLRGAAARQGSRRVISPLESPEMQQCWGQSPHIHGRQARAWLKLGSYGTNNALGLAKFKRARFLIASTSEVYGDPEMHPQQEEYWGNVNPVGPRGVYDEAKRYAEAMTMAYHRQQGVDTHIARIFNTYGPRMRQHDGRAIPSFLRQALEGKPITVFGDGSQTRSFCYVADLVEGLFRLAMSDYHLPVNVGNPNEMTLLELAEK